jgi:hypothetical protein
VHVDIYVRTYVDVPFDSRGSDLYKVLDKQRVGDALDLEVLRETSKEHVSVTLQEMPTPQPTLSIRMRGQ